MENKNTIKREREREREEKRREENFKSSLQ